MYVQAYNAFSSGQQTLNFSTIIVQQRQHKKNLLNYDIFYDNPLTIRLLFNWPILLIA